MKKALLICLALTLAIGLFAGCSMEPPVAEPVSDAPKVEDTDAADVPADKDITIAICPKALDNPIFIDAKVAAEKAGEELGKIGRAHV